MKYFDYAFLKKENSNFWEFYFEQDDILDQTAIRGELYEWKGLPALFLDGPDRTQIKGTVWETNRKQVEAIQNSHYPEDCYLDTTIAENGEEVHLFLYPDNSVRRYDNIIDTGSWSS